MFRHPRRDNFAVARIAGDWLYSLLSLERTSFVDSSRILPSQFFHFCATWEAGWPFCWDEQLRSANRSCGLLECLDPDVEFNLIKDENLGCNEPDCETNHERPERE
jgi:hypothetical protein